MCQNDLEALSGQITNPISRVSDLADLEGDRKFAFFTCFQVMLMLLCSGGHSLRITGLNYMKVLLNTQVWFSQ
jgi:hypothetical protein